jgi:nucleoside-diphosphate-sugar epimerase
MRILLTGATGYLGGWIREAVAKSHDVVCTIRPGSKSELAAPTVEWDLSGELPASLPKFDAIIHAAQSRRYTDFPGGAPDVYAVNCGSTARLLDFAAQSGVKTFCYISSGSVYEPYEQSLSEDAALYPTSLNGASKLAAELLTRPYESAMAISRLRLFFPYGPGQTQRMVPGLIERVRTGNAVSLAGENGLEFSPLFASDIADIVAKAAIEGWTGTFNVAGPETINLRGFVEKIGDILGIVPMFESTSATSPHIVPPLDQLRTTYPVDSMTGVAEGLRRTLANSGG